MKEPLSPESVKKWWVGAGVSLEVLLRKPSPEQTRPFLFRLKWPFERPFSDLAFSRI